MANEDNYIQLGKSCSLFIMNIIRNSVIISWDSCIKALKHSAAKADKNLEPGRTWESSVSSFEDQRDISHYYSVVLLLNMELHH